MKAPPDRSYWIVRCGVGFSSGACCLDTVIGEVMSSNKGIGYLIATATGLFNTASVYAGIIVLAAVGGRINAVLKQVETRVLRWRG